MREYCVYILANRRNGALYIGVTDDLIRRVWEHKLKINDGFTRRYDIDKLVYYESSEYILNAIQREKNLKKWKRKWKLKLIEDINPGWHDLFFDLVDEAWMEENKNMFDYYQGKEIMENANKTGCPDQAGA